MDIDEHGVAEIALIENLQRKDLNIWEEADGLASLASRFGYTQEEIAKKISKSRSTVTELMTVAGLPDDIRTRCRDSNISSKSTLLEIARQFDDAAMHQFLDALQTGNVLPKTKRRSENDATKTAATHTAANGYSFKYSGTNPSFDLTLSFQDGDSRSRAEILRALKAAFDAVKNETASL